MKKTNQDLIYLAACAVNQTPPDTERTKNMDLDALYKNASRHMMTAITAMALESAGIRDERFTQAKGKAIRKNAALDVERGVITEQFEERGIWYMPLKGALLKDLYPQYGMRQMSDNDILFDADRAADVRAVMEALGYTVEQYGETHHDCYHKEPIYNFELHRGLFGPEHIDGLYKYYQDIQGHLIKDPDNRFGYHFTDEDFYIFMLAHAYKHFRNQGTGIRSLLDVYVYLRAKQDLDWEYIYQETDKLGIPEFAQINRRAAFALFTGDALSEEDEEMVEYLLNSGIYGTRQQGHENHIKREIAGKGGGRRGKLRFIWERLFLPADVVRRAYPFYDRHPYLIPVFAIYRLFRCAFFQRGVVKSEFEIMRNIK